MSFIDWFKPSTDIPENELRMTDFQYDMNLVKTYMNRFQYDRYLSEEDYNTIISILDKSQALNSLKYQQ